MDSLTPDSKFFSDRGVDPSRATQQQLVAGQLVRDVSLTTLELSAHVAEQRSEDPLWGLLLAAYWRMEEYAAGSVAISTVSSVAAEIAARTVVEAAVNFQFLLGGNRAERLYAYFDAYIRKEQAEIEKWRKELPSVSSTAEAEAHRKGIEQKGKVLEFQRQLIDSSFNELGVNTGAKHVWGTTLDRFQAIGQTIDYRTTYAGLCSQVHNDAEDLLNGFTMVVAGSPDQVLALRAETEAFSWFAVTLGVRQYVQAASQYWGTFELMRDQSHIMEMARNTADQLASAAAYAVSEGTLK
jgi:hypothetical protein